MKLIDEIDKISRINDRDANNLMTILVRSITVTEIDRLESLQTKHSVLDAFISFLQKYLDEDRLDRRDKLSIVKVLDKMILQKELMELTIEGHSIEDLKIAAHRLGKKSQSAFGDDEV